MLGSGMVVKVIINQVMKAIEKADDKKIASNHEKRIKKLEKNSHPAQEYICCRKCGCTIAKTKQTKEK
jgi:hypothetical protein